jgi:hypothetical protein
MTDKFKKRKQQFLDIAKELAELFNKKNIDYNDNYFNIETEGFNIDKRLAKIDLYLQLRRKFSRLAGFAERRLFKEKIKNNVADENEEDTIKDICIYCLMELLKRKFIKGKK